MEQTIIAYHGTSYDNAVNIKQNGFIKSTSGCLGPAIYFAKQDKARRFALDTSRTKSPKGAVLTCKLTYKKIKIQHSNNGFNDTQWQNEGYDAVYVTKTNMSWNPEWAILNTHQIEVISLEQVS